MTKYLLILGASSDIAKAIAKKYASHGYCLYLAGRSSEELKADAIDLTSRFNVQASAYYFDVLDYSSHERFYDSLSPKPDGVILAVGKLGNQVESESDFKKAEEIINTNFTGCVSILNIVSNDFEERKQGFIIGISSIAGDRGRQSNYIYGSAKAALTAYMSGLRNRLSRSNVSVITVKPGFVKTKMTEGLKLSPQLTASPEDVAMDVFNAYKDCNDVIYTKWYWDFIMFVIKNIPEGIFKKMKL